LENADANRLTELEKAKQKVFGADITVVEPVGLLASQREYLLGSRSEIVPHVRREKLDI
jgi:hypothetical protein